MGQYSDSCHLNIKVHKSTLQLQMPQCHWHWGICSCKADHDHWHWSICSCKADHDHWHWSICSCKADHDHWHCSIYSCSVHINISVNGTKKSVAAVFIIQWSSHNIIENKPSFKPAVLILTSMLTEINGLILYLFSHSYVVFTANYTQTRDKTLRYAGKQQAGLNICGRISIKVKPYLWAT